MATAARTTRTTRMRTGPGRAEPAAPTAHTPGVFTAPTAKTSAPAQENFLTGLLVGAGLTLLGVIVGSLTTRSRR